MLRRPECRIQHLLGGLDRRRIAGADGIDSDRSALCDIVAAFVDHGHVNAHAADGLGCQIRDIDRKVQCGIFIVVIQIRDDREIGDADQRLACQIDVTEDAAVIDHILILKPGAVAELVDLNRDQVFALGEVIGDVEAVRAERILAVTDLHAVHIDIVCGFHALEMHSDSAVVREHFR